MPRFYLVCNAVLTDICIENSHASSIFWQRRKKLFEHSVELLRFVHEECV